MNALLKTAVVVAPFLAVILLLRACPRGGRWAEAVREVDPPVQLALDDEEVIAMAPSRELGVRAGREALRFRRALIRNYADILGTGRDRRLIVVVFSELPRLHDYARRHGHDVGERAYGYHAPDQGAIFLPPGAPVATLRHETVHLLVGQSFGSGPQLSPWLSEGLAQVFECYDPDADPPVPPGVESQDRVRLVALLPGARIDVERLLRLEDYAEFVGVGGMRNYLESHVLVSFLLNRRPRDQLAAYIEAERRSQGGRRQAFRGIYRHDEPAFERDLGQYIRALQAG